MKTKLLVMAFLAGSILPNLLFAQFTQQGSKLVGTGDDATSFQGCSVAISSDGNTAIVGGIGDNFQLGAVWVYIRNGGVWTQQGTKLVGTGAVGNSSISQGYSVAISSDGNTIIEGGYGDGDDKGAAWVFARSGGIWTQQGSKLIGSGAVGSLIHQGWSVALSADGNTAFMGGPGDNATGAVWVFRRSSGVWSQQGTKIVGTGAVGPTDKGSSVACSADGTTFITGSISDNGGVGAVWAFTLTGDVWSQQGSKLVGSDGIDASNQGYSVDISADGNTFIVGEPGDWLNEGAAWVFNRSNGVWTQQGPKLYAKISTSPISVGRAVAIAPDGNMAIVCGPADNGSIGTTWFYTRSAGVWTKQSSTLVGIGAVGAARQSWSGAISSEGTVIEGGPFNNGGEGAAWVFHNLTTGIDPIPGIIPNLEQNYPNPFNSVTKIRFQILKSAFTRLTVYDMMGREVTTLVSEKLLPGIHDVDFNGSNITHGTYFYKFETDAVVETKKMILVK